MVAWRHGGTRVISAAAAARGMPRPLRHARLPPGFHLRTVGVVAAAPRRFSCLLRHVFGTFVAVAMRMQLYATPRVAFWQQKKPL